MCVLRTCFPRWLACWFGRVCPVVASCGGSLTAELIPHINHSSSEQHKWRACTGLQAYTPEYFFKHSDAFLYCLACALLSVPSVPARVCVMTSTLTSLLTCPQQNHCSLCHGSLLRPEVTHRSTQAVSGTFFAVLTRLSHCIHKIHSAGGAYTGREGVRHRTAHTQNRRVHANGVWVSRQYQGTMAEVPRAQVPRQPPQRSP